MMTTTDCDGKTSMLATGRGGTLHTDLRRIERRGHNLRAYLGCLLFLAVVPALFGCATTQVQRAEQLATLGKTYADTVNLAGQEAMASSIAFSLAEIRKERKGGAFPKPEDRSEAIKNQMEILKHRQKLVEMSNQLVALFAEYFANLEKFAKQEISASFETATGGLIDSINDVSQAVEASPQAKAKISNAERASLAKLSGLVARQVHGQALARVLERDASMIGTQLKLMSKILATYSEWIRTRSDMELQEFYRGRVEKPFVGTEELPGSWDQDVHHYLQGTGLSEQLVRAQAAGERMERFWAGYLAGEISSREMIVSLKEMEQVLGAVSAYSKARMDASAAKPH